jgi:hypothetical protein
MSSENISLLPTSAETILHEDAAAVTERFDGIVSQLSDLETTAPEVLEGLRGETTNKPKGTVDYSHQNSLVR